MCADTTPRDDALPAPAVRRPATRPRRSGDAAALAQGITDGDRRALARSISLVENGEAPGADVVARLYRSTGSASLIGVTGAPGVGKSSLVGALIRHVRTTADSDVGVVSVDPSSPFTAGALLGDRIRLSDLFLDRKVFIRSMGTRGHLGGLAEATLQVALLLDAFGKDEIFLETVGVGQSEIEIASIADTVLLVLMPGSGDSVQALKAGIMEIPDVIVINKADHPAARELHQQVRSILMLERERDWMPAIVETQAVNDIGSDTLWQAVLDHRRHLAGERRLEQRRRRNLETAILALASARATVRLQWAVRDDPRLAELLEAVHRREIDPLTCVNRLFREVFTS